VDGSTDYLVVGNHNRSALPERKKAALHEADQRQADQQETARMLASQGNPIKIVDEDEFLSLLISQNAPVSGRPVPG
jgi:hypothetical protein